MPCPLTLSLVAVLGLGSGGCDRDVPLAAAPQAQAPPQAQVTALPGCAAVEFEVSGSDRVRATFPDPSRCPSGLVLVPGDAATFDRPGGGRLTLSVRVVNRAGEAVALPVRLLLHPDSAVVLFPPGLARNGKKGATPQDAAGTIPAGEPHAGAWFWNVGTGTQLGAGATTTPAELVFVVESGVQRVRLGFEAEARRSGPPGADWPRLTNALPDLDTTRVFQLRGDTFEIFRTDISLRFKAGVSDSAKAAFFARHSMTVIGVTGSGHFFVRMPDPGPSLQSFYDALDRFRGEPEVYLVALIPRTPLPAQDPVRFPDDGPGQARSNWLSNSSSTWAMRAIRAPLAWGCETGDYGGPTVAVGIFEWKHQPMHPEFARSMPQLREPTDVQLHLYQPVPQDTVAAKEAHAVKTTGLLTAEGNNGSGIAGVNWRTRLFMYAGYSPGNRPLDLVTGLYVPAGWMVSDGINVLSLSMDGSIPDTIRPKDREAMIRVAAAWLQEDLFEKLPSLLVVFAAGNSRYRGTVTDYVRDTSATLLFGALLLLRDDPKYHDRIMVVTGTESGNRFWTPSNFFRGGATDIAAPAEDVRVLARWTGQTGSAVPLTTDDGTSLAAPLVAGVAAQLLAMNPNLTPAEVKDYILRGAQQPRLSPTTGVPERPNSVAGAPETVYQLDAYGALALLARERPVTPICGFPVRVAPGHVVLERNVAQLFAVTGAEEHFGPPSVAQGGRLIAVPTRDPDGTSQSGVTVLDLRAPLLPLRLPGVRERHYLERDTADVVPLDDGVSLPRLIVRRGDAAHTVQTFDLFPTVPPDIVLRLAETWAVSPAGDFAATGRVYVTPAGFVHRWELVPLGPGAPTNVLQETTPFPTPSAPGTNVPNFQGGRPAWSHDGRRVAFPIQRADLEWLAFDEYGTTALRTQLVSMVAGQRSSVLVPDWGLFALRFSPDGVVLHAREQRLAPVGCRQTRRSPTNPDPPLAQSPVDCLDFLVPPEIVPNLRLRPQIAGADGARVRGSRMPVARPPALERQPNRVQAN